jgi:hypothetical protein
VPQHVIQRGNNRNSTLFAEESYPFHLDCLVDAARKYGCQVGVRGVRPSGGRPTRSVMLQGKPFGYIELHLLDALVFPLLLANTQ